jgi:hypothetical protein
MNVFGRKLEISTNCTTVNCGEPLIAYSTAAVRMTHSAAGAGNAHRMVITNRMT